MKKISTFFMSFMLLFSLTACDSQGGENSGTNSTTENSRESSVQTVESSDNSNGISSDDTSAGSSGTVMIEGKTLVVYYSSSGNTENIAGYIAAAAEADIFKLVPTELYSSDDLDWTKRDSRVSLERNNPELRDVELESVTVPDWNSYKTVFIGYPIWFQIAAWPVNGFVESNDFSGKTVIPFCTSATSGIGESGNLLAEIAGTGNWLEGQRFQSNASEESVRAWVKSLGS